MPGVGTHTTIIQRLALAANAPTAGDPALSTLLTDPNLNGSWATYASADALQSRYAALGAMGPDIFFLMLDYGPEIQDFENVVVKLAATFRAAGELSSQLKNTIDSTLDDLTDDLWSQFSTVFGRVNQILTQGALDLLIEVVNPWSLYLPLRQVDDFQNNWYWGDFLHYVKTGCFTRKLLDNARAMHTADPGSATSRCLSAYALGFLTHYVADTVGHGWVNRIVESPFRNLWQRHHLVENFIDTHVWSIWHDKGTPGARPGDEDNLDTIRAATGASSRTGAARLNYARLDDVINVGSVGIDPLIDSTLDKIVSSIQTGTFSLGVSSLPTLQAPDDPIFTTWAQFLADTIRATYPPDQMHPNRMGRYPTGDDIAGAYGAYRLLLAMQTGEHVEPPAPPMGSDFAAELDAMWKKVLADLGTIPPPPPVPVGTSFDPAALIAAIKAELAWLGAAADAVLNAVGDLIAGATAAGVGLAKDATRAGLYLLDSLLYSAYHSLRMVVVMNGYCGPFIEDLTAVWHGLDLTTLWNSGAAVVSPRYPLEPVVSQRDLAIDPSHPFSPYRPFLVPSTMAPVTMEQPVTRFPAQVLAWTMPEDMLDSAVPGTDDMFSVAGPAPATTTPVLNPVDGTTVATLKTFDGSLRYFGSIMANCDMALTFAAPYVLGTADWPKDVVLPDYNLDADRGYAWPCWDVDWTPTNAIGHFPWDGADPYPLDTAGRIGGFPGINWGKNPGVAPGSPAEKGPRTNPLLPATVRAGTTDPFGAPRSGSAFVNAVALGDPGACTYDDGTFPSVVVNPKLDGPGGDEPSSIDVCGALPTHWQFDNLLPPDYKLAPERFLFSATDPQADVVNVFWHLPYAGATTMPENDGRLSDLLRAAAVLATSDPMLVLVDAVSVLLGGGTTGLRWLGAIIDLPAPNPPAPDPDLAKALAQLTVTGRMAFDAFRTLGLAKDGDLADAYTDRFMPSPFSATAIAAAATEVLDAAYSALWAIRSNDAAWRYQRTQMGWIAVSGFDDTPHRPVNTPTAPYPQYDLDLTLQGKTGPVATTTRYMVASAGTWVGPTDPSVTSITQPTGTAAALGSPPQTGPTGPVPRTVPKDFDTMPGDKIVVYIHGGGSKAEEAVTMANWFIAEGAAAGEKYTVLSLDLPNSAYGSTFDLTGVTGTTYDHNNLDVLNFVRRYVIAFVDALEAQVASTIKDRIVAVIGGSLGGNTSLLLANDYHPVHRRWLRTIVSWSVTATAPARYAGVLPGAWLAAHVGHLTEAAFSPEPADDHATEAAYLQTMYAEPLVADPTAFSFLPLPAQPVMWFRGGYAPGDGLGWQPCKDASIFQSRHDRYEIYTPRIRRWITALNLEQITLSFQDRPPVPTWPDARLMLVAGDNDNYFPNAIHNSTIDVARAYREAGGHGRAEYWQVTGHSIHAERPRLFVMEIRDFLDHPDAARSKVGTVVPTPPRAAYSQVDQ